MSIHRQLTIANKNFLSMEMIDTVLRLSDDRCTQPFWLNAKRTPWTHRSADQLVMTRCRETEWYPDVGGKRDILVLGCRRKHASSFSTKSYWRAGCIIYVLACLIAFWIHYNFSKGLSLSYISHFYYQTEKKAKRFFKHLHGFKTIKFWRSYIFPNPGRFFTGGLHHGVSKNTCQLIFLLCRSYINQFQ